MVENVDKNKKVEQEEPKFEHKNEVIAMFRDNEFGMKRSAFSVLSENLGGILMDEPTQSVSKEMLNELKANRELYLNDTEHPYRKLFIKVFTDGKLNNFLPQTDDFSFEVSIVNAHYTNYTKVFEWNILGKFALALENLLTILKSYSKSYMKLKDSLESDLSNKEENLSDSQEKIKARADFLRKVYELNEKIVTSLLEKNDFRCYVYGVFENKETGKITLKTNNKYLTMKTLKDKFMELDERNGYFVTDYMLLKSGITTYKEYAEAWLAKKKLYDRWVVENVGTETPDALIFHISLRYKEVILGLSKTMGDASIFNEDGNIFFFVGDDAKIPVEIRTKMKLDKLFGGR